MKREHTELAIRNTNKRKQRKQRRQLSDYWTRKSIHTRILPKTFKEIRKLAIEEEITLQGLMEFFFCKLLDNDEAAKKVVADYKSALKREISSISSTDIEDIMRVLEANSPLNDWNDQSDGDNDTKNNDEDDFIRQQQDEKQE